jgi:hypothetical protein
VAERGIGIEGAGRRGAGSCMTTWLHGCVGAWVRGCVGAWRVHSGAARRGRLHGAGRAWWLGTMAKVTLLGTYGIRGSLSACTRAYARGHTRGRKEHKGL